MRDSLGSVVVLTIIVVFVVIVSAYMAFNVNYTKAFRMKNRIISLYEEYDGKCFSTGECETKIRNYAKEIGYNPSVKSCETKNGKDGTLKDNNYCVYQYTVYTDDSKSVDDIGNRYYYRIVTTIDIKIPIIQNVFGYRFLRVTGDTKMFKK